MDPPLKAAMPLDNARVKKISTEVNVAKGTAQWRPGPHGLTADVDTPMPNPEPDL